MGVDALIGSYFEEYFILKFSFDRMKGKIEEIIYN